MSQSKIVGVVDEPISTGKSDALKIGLHSHALVNFIKNTTTPMTIGIQGEWGSGKTSLLNSIKGELTEDPAYRQIWINSWEKSLLATPEEALIKIINEIIEELLETDKDKNRKDKIMSAATTVFKGALRVGATVTLGKKAGEVAEELLETKEDGIKALRGHLYSLVDEIRERKTNPYEKIIIYVDDLDRIEPKDAVQILELLKNIFSVPGCIFILAIDYQVVVKGLEHKFGKQTPENEWEFRAFFDKIIQLPFMMPMGQYDIGNYVTSLLVDIGFIEKDSIDTEDIREIVLYTIGGNPRSIKRLVNSVSLIEIFTDAKVTFAGGDKNTIKETDEEKFLMFSLLCLQIAYPAIYSLLVEQPNFTKWDNDFAFSHTNKEEEKEKELFDQEYGNAIKTEDFDEEWEKALFRICYIRPRLKPKATDISRFFSFIKDQYTSEEKNLGETIQEVLDRTSVTSVTSTDTVQEFKKSKHISEDAVKIFIEYRNNYLDNLEKNGSTIFKTIKRGNYFAWYAKFKSPLGIFSNNDFRPRWLIEFNGRLEIRVDGETPNDHVDFINYVKSRQKELEKKIDASLGEWIIRGEEGKQTKIISFERKIDNENYRKVIRKEFGNIENYFKDEKNKADCISWAKETVAIFEKTVIDLVEDYEKQSQNKLKSPKGYSG